MLYRESSDREVDALPTRRSSDLAPGSRARPSLRGHPPSARRGRNATGRATTSRVEKWAGVDPSRKRAIRLVVAGSAALLLRSEEHTSELQSPDQHVCRLLLEKKN